MRTKIAIIGALGLAACGEKKQQEAPPAASVDPAPVIRSHKKQEPRTGDPRPQPKLTATVDGKPVPMQAAFAWNDRGALQLLVTSVPATCGWATGRMRSMEPGEEDFSAILGTMLKPDGTRAWGIRQTSFGANTHVGDGGDATVSGEVVPGQALAITLGFAQDSGSFGDDPVKQLKVDGTIDALVCGEPKRDDVAEAAPPPAQAGTMTVAGQKIPIAGAVIEQKASGERTIVLSSGAASCDGFPHEERSAVAVMLHYKAAGDDVWQADLSGEWIGGQKADQVFDEGKLVVTPAAVPAGATTVELKLSGSTEIMDYPVALEGPVTAQVCPAS